MTQGLPALLAPDQLQADLTWIKSLPLTRFFLFRSVLLCRREELQLTPFRARHDRNNEKDVRWGICSPQRGLATEPRWPFAGAAAAVSSR